MVKATPLPGLTIARLTLTPSPPRRNLVRRIDPFGAGALLFAVIGFVAVLVLLRPSAPPDGPRPSVSVYTHHPVDRHDELAPSLSGISLRTYDAHHPVDRHEQP